MAAVFTFRNTHDAITGERRLLDGGVKVVVMTLPASLGAGCGLCLRVARTELDCSRRLLKEAAIEPQAVYAAVSENGQTFYNPLIEPAN